MNLKLYEIAPARDPLFQKRLVRRRHKLIAPRQIGRDPTRDVDQPVGGHSTTFTEPAIPGNSVTVSEILAAQERRLRNNRSFNENALNRVMLPNRPVHRG